jgi:hypothetical protein
VPAGTHKVRVYALPPDGRHNSPAGYRAEIPLPRALPWAQEGHGLGSDAGPEHLKGLTALQELYLGSTNVTDAGVGQLKKSLPNVSVTR